MGVSTDCPNVWSTTYYLRNGESYRLQIWPVHSEGPSEQKPTLRTFLLVLGFTVIYFCIFQSVIFQSCIFSAPKKFREKAAWAYPGTAQIFWILPIISGTGKATDFKFGQYIQRVHPNKSSLKILEKRERGRIEGLPIFSGTPYYLRTGESYRFQI